MRLRDPLGLRRTANTHKQQKESILNDHQLKRHFQAHHNSSSLCVRVEIFRFSAHSSSSFQISFTDRSCDVFKWKRRSLQCNILEHVKLEHVNCRPLEFEILPGSCLASFHALNKSPVWSELKRAKTSSLRGQFLDNAEHLLFWVSLRVTQKCSHFCS